MLGISAESDNDESHMEDLELVADDLMAGIKSGNAGMVARALRTAALICQNYDKPDAGSSGPGRSFSKYSKNAKDF